MKLSKSRLAAILYVGLVVSNSTPLYAGQKDNKKEAVQSKQDLRRSQDKVNGICVIVGLYVAAFLVGHGLAQARGYSGLLEYFDY